ncbi:sentrin-specific protease 2-like [Peromyscus californicus insignis]|uniref:sentrin-specific protease 2-like n=1 Tax=Peromyscus californicus insignis TaxID=564181 RepID=UPI0022A67A06|nr:sentrin-specific protease 2-like [Peromyscus californicus insignis]
MSSVDTTSPNGLRGPSAIKRTTTRGHPPRLRRTCAWSWKSEGCTTADSRHLSKGNAGSPCAWQPRQHHEMMSPEHPRKGQKRKRQEEWGTLVQTQEPAEPRRRVKQELEIELGCEEPGKDQIRKPQEEDRSQLKPRECAKGSQDEALTEVKSVDGGKGHKRSHCNTEEGVQEHHKYRRLLEHLQPGDYVNSDPHSAPTSPVDTWKIKGCVEGQIHRSEPTHSEPEQSACAVTREDQSPVNSEKRSSEEKISNTEEIVGTNLNNDIRGHHPQPDFLGGAQVQIFIDSVSNDILNNKIPIPEAKGKALADQEKGRGLDHGPDVTVDMEKEIRSALGPGPEDEILSCAFKLRITRGDMQTLKETQWLNDEVINFYMNLLMERNQNQGYPSVHAFNTFFYTKLKCGGYRSVKRWTQAVNLFTKDLILVPIHLDVHWSLVVIDLRKKHIVYLDSMGQERPDVLEMIFQYLQDESKAQKNIDLNPLEWRQYSMPAEEIPQQRNGSDCGMFTCKYADYISRGQPLTFSQQHMPLFRKKMVWEILHKRLL